MLIAYRTRLALPSSIGEALFCRHLDIECPPCQHREAFALLSEAGRVRTSRPSRACLSLRTHCSCLTALVLARDAQPLRASMDSPPRHAAAEARARSARPVPVRHGPNDSGFSGFIFAASTRGPTGLCCASVVVATSGPPPPPLSPGGARPRGGGGVPVVAPRTPCGAVGRPPPTNGERRFSVPLPNFTRSNSHVALDAPH